MSVLEILEAGPYTSVQDRGRFGGQRYGLGTAGAMDVFALAMANALVGNAPERAAIEIGPLPVKFRVAMGAMRIALAGAARGVSVNGRALVPLETALLGEGDVVQVRGCSAGVFSYLALEGGIRAEPKFGSLSMHARSGIGSPYPRGLQGGDRIEAGEASARQVERAMLAPVWPAGPLRVVLGPQDDHFSQETIDTFLAAEWVISKTSDRMGFRLEGPVLAHARGHNIISDGIANGAIQIPGNGQPLVLLVDRGTTGGYPKIATIISADLGRLAQTPAGAGIRFTKVSVAEAQAEARRVHGVMAGLRDHVHDIGGGDLSSEFLLAANLAGGAINAFE